MITLTKTELNWLIILAGRSASNNKALMEQPGQQYAALHKLEYEKMSSLAEKLEKAKNSGKKRIALKGCGV